MDSTPYIFKEKLIKSRLEHFTKDSIPNFEEKFKEIVRWYNASAEKYLDRTKETEIQGTFMTRLFNGVFGYNEIIDDGDCYNQVRESKSILDTSESDGALGFFYKSSGEKDVRVVIELKDARTPLDKKQNRSSHLTPVEQAFQYANKNGSKCGWVIVSNFIETRLYKSTSSLEYESFDMRKMNEEKEFIRFYYFLNKNNLINETGKSIIDELYLQNEAEGADITNQFYNTYKDIRNNLFKSLKINNPDKDEIFLFTKTQKLMDRFVFICFCEDCNLLPANIYQKLIDTARQSYSFSRNKLWDQLRGLFASIDQGNPPMKINRYNGGLFKEDKELESLIIPDDILESFIQLSDYDFNSDLNVNILGQIFEQSISDVEHIKAEINGEKVEIGKQKEDGIFYTPYYVTRYIVEQTVGVYLDNKKKELKKSIFRDGPIVVSVKKESTGRVNQHSFTSWMDIPTEKDDMSEEDIMTRKFVEQLHLKYWEKYEDVLRNIKICDPACGSGAFLNQCFDYLKEEMDFVLGMKYQFDAQRSFFDIDKEILQNNLFGVDINPESVEITKLSLWLKTAKSNQTLATLDENIKCGNSIVADKSIVDSAFEWEKEFPEVFANGGFDIIIGNPPYGAKVDKSQKEYCAEHYKTVSGGFDTYRVFFELGFDILKAEGYLGYITPNTYFDILSGEKLRRHLFDNYTLLKIVELYNVFPNAVVEPVISVYQKRRGSIEEFEIVLVPRKTALSSTFIQDGISRIRQQEELKKGDKYIFNYKIDENKLRIINRIKDTSVKLSDKCDVYNGAKPYEVGKGIPPQTKEMTQGKVYNGYEKVDDSWIPYIRGKCIQRYLTMWDGEYIKYGNNLAAPRNPDNFFRKKIFVRQTGDTIIAQIDNGNVANNTLHIIVTQDKLLTEEYLLGILNSTFMTWYYQTTHPLEVGKPMAEVKKNFIEELPIVISSEEEQKKLVEFVTDMLELCDFRHNIKRKFIEYIVACYEPKNTTDKMMSFDKMTFKDFCSELKKQKVKLSSSEKMDLLSLYNDKIKEITEITKKINFLQKTIDDIVYKIYGVDDETSKSIEQEISIEI